MTFEIGLVFVLLAVSILLFVTNWIRSDIIAILVLLGVVLSGILPVEEALSGFSSDAVLAIAGLMDVSIKPLAVAVIVGAAATYLLPVGHPAPLLVQKPGSYRGKDYLKFGSGLFLLTIIIAGIVLPIVWPF